MEYFRLSVADLSQTDISNLLGFFQNGYGDKYLGHKIFAEDYIGKSDTVLGIGSVQRPKAVTLSRADRLGAISTSANTQVDGSRAQNMLSLLEICKETQPNSWITIDKSSAKMQRTAEQAGMFILSNERRLMERLDKIGELAMHRVNSTPSGLTIVRENSHHGPDYVQYAWGWKD